MDTRWEWRVEARIILPTTVILTEGPGDIQLPKEMSHSSPTTTHQIVGYDKQSKESYIFLVYSRSCTIFLGLFCPIFESSEGFVKKCANVLTSSFLLYFFQFRAMCNERYRQTQSRSKQFWRQVCFVYSSCRQNWGQTKHRCDCLLYSHSTEHPSRHLPRAPTLRKRLPRLLSLMVVLYFRGFRPSPASPRAGSSVSFCDGEASSISPPEPDAPGPPSFFTRFSADWKQKNYIVACELECTQEINNVLKGTKETLNMSRREKPSRNKRTVCQIWWRYSNTRTTLDRC